jgi:hypothetical protein
MLLKHIYVSNMLNNFIDKKKAIKSNLKENPVTFNSLQITIINYWLLNQKESKKILNFKKYKDSFMRGCNLYIARILFHEYDKI